MFEHDLQKENAYRFSRFDSEHPLSSISAHTIELEDQVWPTAEHYVWWQLLANGSAKKHILEVADGVKVFKYGAAWYRKKIHNWTSQRRIFMTRALYIKVQMYSEVRAALDETGNQDILETSLYDHYWGIGRDQRGDNTMGKIWMDIRSKLQQKEEPA